MAASPLRLSRTPGQVRGAGPLYGAHTKDVLREWLGFGGDTVEDLAAAGVVETAGGPDIEQYLRA